MIIRGKKKKPDLMLAVTYPQHNSINKNLLRADRISTVVFSLNKTFDHIHSHPGRKRRAIMQRAINKV